MSGEIRNLVLGADGGGTKTLGILAGLDGKELARRQVGPGNPNVAGVEGAAGNLVDLIVGCCSDGNTPVESLGSVVLGLAGAGSAPIRIKLETAIQELLARRGIDPLPLTIVTDARIALEGAFGGGPGIIVIAGTGSIVLAKTGSGEELMVGGWGRVLGDEGSGYFMGYEALRTLAQELDGRKPRSLLGSLLGERFGWTDREKLVVAVYQQKYDLPALAPLVCEAADKGDPAARDILERGAMLLAEQVGVCIRALQQSEGWGVVFVGGLIDRETTYRQVLASRLQKHYSGVTLRQAQFPPALGAVLLGQSLLKRK
jgi:glucosamine kinase